MDRDGGCSRQAFDTEPSKTTRRKHGARHLPLGRYDADVVLVDMLTGKPNQSRMNVFQLLVWKTRKWNYRIYAQSIAHWGTCVAEKLVIFWHSPHSAFTCEGVYCEIKVEGEVITPSNEAKTGSQIFDSPGVHCAFIDTFGNVDVFWGGAEDSERMETCCGCREHRDFPVSFMLSKEAWVAQVLQRNLAHGRCSNFERSPCPAVWC